MFKNFIQWMIESSWFHKYNSVIGGFCAGLWVQAHYWKEIKGTLEIWGIPQNEYMATLILIIGASGISTSIIGTVVKNKQIATAAKEAKNSVDSE